MKINEKDFARAERFLARPRTVAALAAHVGIDLRTAYRWLARMRDLGLPLVRLGTGNAIRYRLLPDDLQKPIVGRVRVSRDVEAGDPVYLPAK